MSNIRLRNVTKRFGSTVTLHQVNLDIEDGEFAVSSALPVVENRRYCA